MTPQELLERLEGLGIISSKVLGKIRRQIEDPEKQVKPKAIISFLVKKEHLTKAQAAKLLKEIEAPKAVQHDDLEVANVPAEAGYDTDDLTATAQEVVEAKAEKPAADAGATMDAIATEVGAEEIVDIVEIQEVVPAEPAGGLIEAVPAAAPLADPLGDYGADYGATEFGGEEKEKVPDGMGFQGKRLKRDQWATKWLYIGFGILGSLLIFGAVLYYAVNRVSAEDQFKAAMESFENGSYSDAIEKFDQYIEDNPKHEKVPTAKVRRVQALLAQTYESRNWDETISRAKNQLPILMEEPDVKMDLIRDDLGVMLPNAALQISDRAMKQKTLEDMEAQLAKAQDAKSVVDNPSYLPNSIRKRTSVANVLDKLENNILSVEGLIKKENDYGAALVEIRGLGDASKTDEAFSVFQNLTRRYGELATREELQTLMREVSIKERDLIKTIQPNLNVSNQGRPSSADATLVLATKAGEKLDASRDLIMPILAAGTLYGIDSVDGTVLWRKWLGFQTKLQPQMFNEDQVLVCDEQNQDVMMVKRIDGKVIWRTEVNEPFVLPAFNEAMVVVTAKSGKIMKLDPRTGQVVSAVQLPQQTSVSALIADRDPYIYQPGYYSNIYVLSSEDLQCRDVHYLGHYKGSIEVAPKNWIGHLLIAVNGGNRCDLHILKPKKDEVGLDEIQLMNRLTTGPVTTPLTRFGRWMMVASDNGDLKVLQINPAEEEVAPITLFVSEKISREAGQSAFFLTQGSQLWVAGKGITKYRIKAADAKFNRQIITNPSDRFVAPLHMIQDGLLHVRRRAGSGMLSISAVDPNTLKQIWRTDLGGPLASEPVMLNGSLQAVSNQGDLFLVDGQGMSSGYSDNGVMASTVVENLVFSRTVDLGENKFAAVGPDGREDVLYIDGTKSKLSKLQAPAGEIAADPIGVDGDLIIPSKKGVVVRIDARTGRMVGAPFQPAIRPGVDVDWKNPVHLEGTIFAIAKGSADGTPSAVYLLDTGEGRSVKQLAGMESDSTIKSGLAAIDKTVMVVVTQDTGDKLVGLDARKGLGAVGVADLPGTYVGGPWVVGNQVMVALDTDEIACFDATLKPVWKAAIPQGKLAGHPRGMNGKIAIALQSGVVLMIDPSSGQATEMDLGQPIVSFGQDGNRLLFGGMDGTVHVSTAQ